ncbi:hypothetical protein [Bifidobacterium crudilactis]|jgi:hypothetical protein|uniref:hypothetical protein n=1 Tax=Bifidobacterium crudilactis TaxID=327277 RepID=UPI002F35586D
MMDPTQTGMLLQKASDFDGRNLTQTMVDSWCEALRDYVTVEDAKQAVVEFYGDPKWAESNRRPWIMPADINARVKRIRETRSIDESQMQQLLEPFNLNADESWLARRKLLANLRDGLSEEKAVLKAVEQSRGYQIEQAPSKPRKPRQYHFAGRLDRMNLNDVIGETT